MYKILNLRKEVGIAMKNKETNSQLEPIRNSFVAIMHQPVTVRPTFINTLFPVSRRKFS